MIHGRNLIVALDGVAVAGAKSCSLQLSQNFIEACSPSSGRTRDKIPTTYDWSVSVDCLIPDKNLPVSLKDKLIAGTKCLLTLTDGDGDDRYGVVYVKSCDESGTVGSLATFKASFEPSGPLYNKYILYDNGSYPQEGKGLELSIYHDYIYYDYDSSRQDGPYVIEIAPNQAGKVILFTTDVWAAYANSSKQSILTSLNNKDTQWLEDNATEFGNSDHIFELSASQYRVIVINQKPRIMFLYE